MVRKIAGFFVPKDGTDVEKRSVYGIVCGCVGIFLNIILFAGKLLAGIITSSISITADALNNLSDAGSSIVTLAGFKLAAQKPDSIWSWQNRVSCRSWSFCGNLNHGL